MNLENLLQKRDSSRRWRIASHVLFWLFLFGTLFYANKISINPYRDLPSSYLEPFRTTIILAIVFYPLVYFVGLKLFRNKQWSWGVAATMILFLIYAVLDYTGEMIVLKFCETCKETIAKNNPAYYNYLQRGFFPIILSRVLSLGIFIQLMSYLTFPIAVKAGLGYHRYYIRNLQLARDNVQLELDFLKAQVNPHFLFNTLNNLYGLIILQRNDQSAETVSRLSDFMRYTLHDSTEQEISLVKEINLIRNYIELEKLRLNYTKVVFEHSIDREDYSLPPLLFMPVVENAFKYSTDNNQGALITMRLEVQKFVLTFMIENSFDPKRKTKQAGGLGLMNLQKRLLLHFPARSTYQAHIEGSKYSTCLTLHLA